MGVEKTKKEKGLRSEMKGDSTVTQKKHNNNIYNKEHYIAHLLEDIITQH